MPALPWTWRQAADPGRTYVAMASRLPLRRGRSVPGFLRDALAVRRQLARAPGLVGYALDAQLARKTFWTFSVWEDRASLDAFAASGPHRAITRRLRPLMGQATQRGRDGREEIEWRTDRLADAPWQAPGPDRAQRLADLTATLLSAAFESGLLPAQSALGIATVPAPTPDPDDPPAHRQPRGRRRASTRPHRL